jgi:hypothetical protein
MPGPADDPGINTRALAELFQQAGERASEVSYSLSASVLELYNERVIDLLAGSKDTSEWWRARVALAAGSAQCAQQRPRLLFRMPRTP